MKITKRKTKRARHRCIFRFPKLRGRKNKRRNEVKISDVSPEGFRLRTFNRDYFVLREDYPWFKDATQREIQKVTIALCMYDDPTESPDEGDILHWECLDLHMGTNFFEYPDRFPFRAPSVRGVLRLDLFDKERKEREEMEKRHAAGDFSLPFVILENFND